jgi:hypothetical protein
MIRTMSLKTRREILSNIRNQYQESDWLGKTKFLDGFIAANGYDRKYAIKLLNSTEKLTNHLSHAKLESNMTNRFSRR